jgi:hypothetical protein
VIILSLLTEMVFDTYDTPHCHNYKAELIIKGAGIDNRLRRSRAWENSVSYFIIENKLTQIEGEVITKIVIRLGDLLASLESREITSVGARFCSERYNKAGKGEGEGEGEMACIQSWYLVTVKR